MPIIAQPQAATPHVLDRAATHKTVSNVKFKMPISLWRFMIWGQNLTVRTSPKGRRAVQRLGSDRMQGLQADCVSIAHEV